jgi:hypothetical protein
LRRPSSLIDLVDAVAQVHVSTIELVKAMGEIGRAANGDDLLFLQVSRKHLNLTCRPYPGRGRTTFKNSIPCVGTFGLRLETFPWRFADLSNAAFYERQTALTLCADQWSLYIGKYWIELSAPSGRELQARPPTDVDLILERIRTIDAENSQSPPRASHALAQRYERDDTLARLLKTLRGDACQICGFSFRTRDGRSYTECHHLEQLANGGLDVTRNMVVLCANHHRQFHHGNVAVLAHTPDVLSVSIDGTAYTCALTLTPPSVKGSNIMHGDGLI